MIGSVRNRISIECCSCWDAYFELNKLEVCVRILEQRRHAELLGLFGEHQQRRQQALAVEAGLQQVWAAVAARPQPQELMLYTVDGGAAGYDTKRDELHPVSQGASPSNRVGLAPRTRVCCSTVERSMRGAFILVRVGFFYEVWLHRIYFFIW